MNGTYFLPVESDKVIGYLQNQTPVLRVSTQITDVIDQTVNLLRIGVPSVQIICRPNCELDGSEMEKNLTAILKELELKGETFNIETKINTFLVTRKI